MKQAFFVLEGTTTKNAGAVDYSTVNNRLVLTPPAGAIWDIHSLVVTIEDEDTAGDKFGNISALGTGLTLLKESKINGVLKTLETLFDGMPMTRTTDWLRIGGKYQPFNDASATTSSQIILTFAPMPKTLNANGFERLAWPLVQNFTDLAGLFVMANLIERY